MGIVHPGVPPGLLEALKACFEIRTFVETGTFTGHTAYKAASMFEQVYTIEASKEYYKRARRAVPWPANVKPILGHSIEVLPEILQQISPDTAVAFWLDAHWCGGESYGVQDECPVLEEIRRVQQFSGRQFILIDDARYFVAPPPAPHDEEQWPTLAQVVDTLNDTPHETERPFVILYDDVIVSVPMEAKSVVMEFCTQQNLNPMILSPAP